MKILTFLFLFFFSIYPNNSYAEIFYVDMNKIINQTNVGKHINKEFEKLKKINNTKSLKTKNELIKREESLIAQKNILDKNEFNNRLNIFKIDVSNFNKLNQKNNDDLQDKLRNYRTTFLELIEPILLDYVRENKITYLLQKKYIIVGRNDLNKTSDIINILDKKINISNFNDSISK